MCFLLEFQRSRIFMKCVPTSYCLLTYFYFFACECGILGSSSCCSLEQECSCHSVLLQVIKDSVFLGQLRVVQNPQMEGFQLSKTHKQAFSQNVLEIDFNGIHLWMLLGSLENCSTIEYCGGPCWVGILVKLKCLEQQSISKTSALEPAHL